MLTAVPSLDELARDPSLATGLPAHTLKSLMLRTAALLAVLAAAEEQPTTATPAAYEPDKWISADEAAALLQKPRRWIVDNADRLPWVRRVSRKKLLCSEAGLRKWLVKRHA